MTTIKVNYEGAINIISKSDKGIKFNSKELLLDHTKLKDKNERKEATELYEDEVMNGIPEKIAKIKAALYFAPYVEEGDAALNEIFDSIIIILLGYVEDISLKKDFTIYIKDDYIYSNKIDKTKRYSLPTTGSTVNYIDWNALIEQLANDQ